MTYMGPKGCARWLRSASNAPTRSPSASRPYPAGSRRFPERQFLNEFPHARPQSSGRRPQAGAGGILGPLQVQRWFRELKGVVTFTCTEVNDARALDELVAALEK